MRNRYRRFNISLAFALASALSLQAQSSNMDAPWRDSLQLQGDSARPLLSATLVDGPAVDGSSINGSSVDGSAVNGSAVNSPAMGTASSESDLPDAPSATKPDASTGGAAASPVVKKPESQGAPVAAKGGPLWVDRGVADRNYLLVMGGMVGASIANAELTLHCFSQHASCNDLPTSLRSRSAVYGIGIPADLGIAYLTYCLKRKHNHMWYVPAAAVTGTNIFFAYRAYHWTQEHSKP